MSPRRFAPLLLALGLACGSPAAPRVESAVLVCLDTVRYDTLALAHAAAGDDPASRRWNDATRLARVQSTAPWTLPAIASVFTGRTPGEHRAGTFLREVADLSRSFPLPLAKGMPTLAGHLSQAGWETAAFVAHPWFRSRFGLDRGFASLDGSPRDAEAVLQSAFAWLDARGERAEAPPFFLYLHFMEAHAPALQGRRALSPALTRLDPELRRRAKDSQPSLCRDPELLDCLRYQAYVGAVAELRRRVAALLDGLDARGLLSSSVVVVFSDHGEEFGEHAAEEASRALDPRGRFGLGHGHSLYQEQLHVPVAVWHPGLAAGEVETPASLADLAPTLLGWLGAEGDAGFATIAGEDLGPRLAEGRTPDPERPLFSSSVAFGPEREAVLRGHLKRVGDGGSGAGPLLFDLARDPREKAPLDPATRPELGELLAAYRGDRRGDHRGDRVGVEPRAVAPATPSAEELEALQGLGYLEDATLE